MMIMMIILSPADIDNLRDAVAERVRVRQRAERGDVGSAGLSLTTEQILLTKRSPRDDVYDLSLILLSLLLLLWACNLPKMQQPDDKR